MNSSFEKYKKQISIWAIMIVLLSSLSPVFAKKVEAQWVVWDPTNFVPITATAVNSSISTGSYVGKEYGLDAVAWVLVNLIIERISASTVTWINSGFKGSPAYITNPESYFLDLGDKVAGQFIFSNPNLNFLCGPISARIKIALSQSYRGDNTSWQCTLTDVKGNMEDFINDFDKGGWDKFFMLTQDSQNNPIGAYIQAEGTLARQIANKVSAKNNELSWGQGFLSAKDCVQPSGIDETLPTDSEDDEGQIISRIAEEANSKIPDSPSRCLRERITTPGSVISEQLNKTLGIGGDKLAVADEFNELVSALLNQLVSKALKGLGGLIRPDPSNNNRTFTSQLTSSTATSTTDYFGESQNTNLANSILNSVQTPTGATPPNPTYPEGTSIPIRSSCNPAVEDCSAPTASGARSR